VQHVYSPEGFEKEIRYLDIRKRPRADGRRSFGEVREYDERGLATRVTNLKSPSKAENYYKKSYDEQGNLTDWVYLTSEGKPAVDADGIHGQHSVFDQYGNETERSFFGIDG